MILRRFVEHVRAQNWFAVGLDVLVVIVGIFLGMQVTEWNEARKERMLEQVYIDRLLADLDTDINYSARLSVDSERALADIAYLEDVLADENLLIADHERFVRSVRAISWTRPWVITSDTWDELNATGRVLLLRDVELRRRLSNYYRFEQITTPWLETMRELSSAYRLAMSGLLTSEVEARIRRGEPVGVSIEYARDVRQRFLQRPELVNMVPGMTSIQVNVANRQSYVAEAARELKDYIRG